MNNKIYSELVKRVNELDRELECHKEREYELLRLVGIERKYRHFYSKYITLSDCCSLIPFDTFDLAINDRLYHRACTKEYLLKLITNSIYGLGTFDNRLLRITDVRISLKESLVDLITEE